MSNVITVASRILESVFTGANNPLFRLIVYISNSPILVLSAVFLIIGFGVGLISRLIHS